MKTKLIFYTIIISLIILFSCSKKENKEIIEKNVTINNDTLPNSIDSLKNKSKTEKEIPKEKTFKEFAKEFIKEVPKSKKYYFENSESFIQCYDYQDKVILKKENAELRYNELKTFLNEGKYKIADKKIVTNEPDILYAFCFRKDKDNNWKFYKIEAGD